MILKNINHILFSIIVGILFHEGQCKRTKMRTIAVYPNGDSCWVTFKAKEHFVNMATMEDKYKRVRTDFQEAFDNERFDNAMFKAIIEKRGIAERAVHAVGGKPEIIPAGFNLGGNSMIRMRDSLLFVHRMKLRNDTHFRINYLHNDLENMVLIGRLLLHDLHLQGNFERALTDTDSSKLFYVPTYGEIQLLLKDVTYAIEGRYRLLTDRLNIELIISEINVKDVMLTYTNSSGPESMMKLQPEGIADFLDTLKSKLDNWLKDFFNDYLVYFPLADGEVSVPFAYYDKAKTSVLNEYMDNVIDLMKTRLQKFRMDNVMSPNFTIYSVDGGALSLSHGAMFGFDSMYRRSVATGKLEDGFRYVDAIVGFSELKLIYGFEAVLKRGSLPVHGKFILSASDITARMGLVIFNNPEAVDVTFDSFISKKPEMLIERGPSEVLANFEHVIEIHVYSLMRNVILHHIRMLNTITHCTPKLRGYIGTAADSESDEIIALQTCICHRGAHCNMECGKR